MRDESNHHSDNFIVVYGTHRGLLPSFCIINDDVAHKMSLRNGTSEETGLKLAQWLLWGEGGTRPTVRCGAADRSSFLQGEPVKLT